MRRPALLLFLVASLVLATAPRAAVPSSGGYTVLRGARLLDGAGGAPIDDAVVVIQAGRIVEVGSAANVSVPSNARLVDYTGKVLIPGLISNHSHVGQVEGLQDGSRYYTRENILRQLRQFEAYGVTTVTALGMNGPLLRQLRTQQHAGRNPGADLFGADRGIGVPNGAPPVDRKAEQLARPATAEQAREAVRQMAARQTDLVKLWLDDFNGALPVKMKPEIYQAVIAEAHARGLRVAAHIHDLEDAKAVVRAGVDILAHGVRDQPVDAELIQQMKERSVWYVPTLSLDESTFVYADRPAWMDEPFFQRALSPALRKQLADAAWVSKTRQEPKSVRAREALAMNQRNLKTLYDAGVRVGFGTDSGATPLRIPGVEEHRELALLVEAGLTPLQALTLATREAAALLRLEDRGVLAAGKWADLVVLDGDPGTAISQTTRIHAVWHRGRQAAGPIADFKP